MYRCEICQAVSQPRQKLLRHIIYRLVPNPFVPRDNGSMPMRSEIAREYAVCAACLSELRDPKPAELPSQSRSAPVGADVELI